MPYIKTKRAKQMIENDELPNTAGELNFALSTLVSLYLYNKDELDYQTLCEVAGVLRTMYREFERRLLDEYEKEKQKTGADPYAILFGEDVY